MKLKVITIILPPVLIAGLYLIFLGHRSDYAGHFMAGFGGTLLLMMVAVEIQSRKGEPPPTGPVVLVVLVACILFGTLEEATTFRLAKFDEVDYCNQNLGAVLATLCTLSAVPERPERTPIILPSIIVACIFLFGGFYYAFQ